jgi:hypothetical protein
MGKTRYLGVHDPKAAFEALKPLHAGIIRMKTQVRPFGPDYLILDAVQSALVTAAYHFTREHDFYSAKPPG